MMNIDCCLLSFQYKQICEYAVLDVLLCCTLLSTLHYNIFCLCNIVFVMLLFFKSFLSQLHYVKDIEHL